MNTPVIKTEQLCKTYRQYNKLRHVLCDISFEIYPGEIIYLTGNNGSGKSTLLRIMSRMTTPTSGKITGYGKLTALLETRTGFHPELTGLENISLFGAILGMRKKEIMSYSDAIISFSGLGTGISSPVKRYSSGMQARLALSAACHYPFDILILDELLVTADQDFQLQCLEKFKSLSKEQNKTIILTGHDSSELPICNRRLLLYNGKLE